MSLHWKVERHDKRVCVEDDKKHGKMTTIRKGVNEEPWCHQIVRNFALPKDADLSVQPSTDVDKKKGTRLVSDTWCDYVVVSDTLVGLAPVAQPKGEAAAQPAKKITRKKISKRSNLDALAAKLSPERSVPSVRVEPSYVFNDDLPPSPPCVSIREQLEGTKTAEAEVEKPVEVELEAERRLWKRR
ncbi:hypothetical protein Hanom_Chr02g00122131 [Helianthus anomalus]